MTVQHLFLMSFSLLRSDRPEAHLTQLWYELRAHVRQPENLFAVLNLLYETSPTHIDALIDVGFEAVRDRDDFENIAALFLCLAWYGEAVEREASFRANWEQYRSEVRIYFHTPHTNGVAEVRLGSAPTAQAATIVREARLFHIELHGLYDQTHDLPTVPTETPVRVQTA